MSYNIAPLAIGKCYHQVDQNGAFVKGLGDLQSVAAAPAARSNAGQGGTHKTFTFRFGSLYGSTPNVAGQVMEVACPAYWPARGARGAGRKSRKNRKASRKNRKASRKSTRRNRH